MAILSKVDWLHEPSTHRAFDPPMSLTKWVHWSVADLSIVASGPPKGRKLFGGRKF